jgi:hypothetical protein
LVVRAFGGLALEKLARALTMEKIRLLRPFEFLTPKIVQFRALFRCQQPRGIQGRLFLIIAWIPYRRLKLPPRRRPSTVPVPREQAIAIADPGVPLLRRIAKGVLARIGAILECHVLSVVEPATVRVAYWVPVSWHPGLSIHRAMGGRAA